jgi:hypothetical protein
MLPFAQAMLALLYVGHRLGNYPTSSHVLLLGLRIVGIGNAVIGCCASPAPVRSR